MSLQDVASLNFVLTEENDATSNNKIIVPMSNYVDIAKVRGHNGLCDTMCYKYNHVLVIYYCELCNYYYCKAS